MSTSANASIEFEAGQVLVPMHALTDSGDHKAYTSSHGAPWSAISGFAPEVYQDGLMNGGEVTPAASESNDVVDVAALSCYLAGVLTAVAADTDVAVSRGVDTDTHRITSITVTSLGAIAAVAGVDGTAFSEVRGADGGPPFIPVGDIEIAQVRLNSVTAAPVAASEIIAVWGQHCERWDYPPLQINTLDGQIEFAFAHPLNHTGGVTKKVYAKVYLPVFQMAARAVDFAPIEQSFSSTSQEYYGGVAGGSTSSMGQGKFTALLEDGHTDSLLSQAGKNITVRFKQDRNRTPYSLTQGILGITRTYPKSSQVNAACTLTGEKPTRDFAV